MVNHAIRRGAVKRLRAVGLSYDLSVVSDNASKAKVLEMADGILQEELDDDERAEAELLWKSTRAHGQQIKIKGQRRSPVRSRRTGFSMLRN